MDLCIRFEITLILYTQWELYEKSLKLFSKMFQSWSLDSTSSNRKQKFRPSALVISVLTFSACLVSFSRTRFAKIQIMSTTIKYLILVHKCDVRKTGCWFPLKCNIWPKQLEKFMLPMTFKSPFHIQQTIKTINFAGIDFPPFQINGLEVSVSGYSKTRNHLRRNTNCF